MTHQANIEKYGGKASSLLAQYDRNPDLIFPFTLVEVDRWEAGEKPNFNFQARQIVRGSAIGDEKGLVDVIQTLKESSPGQLDIKINAIIEQSRSEGVKSYANWEGLMDYRGVSSLIVQPLNINQKRGSVVEHPNIEGHYLVNVVYNGSHTGRNGSINQYLVDENGKIISQLTFHTVEDEGLIRDIVLMKKKSREAGFISEDMSSQVEFGLTQRGSFRYTPETYDYSTSLKTPVVFYQEREFLPFDFDTSINPDNYIFNQFGRVGPNTKLRVIKLGSLNPVDGLEELCVDGVPSAYIFSDSCVSRPLPLHFQPNNMSAVIIPADFMTIGGKSLEHNMYRWVQKARLFLGTQNREYSTVQTGDIITISEDGKVKAPNDPSIREILAELRS